MTAAEQPELSFTGGENDWDFFPSAPMDANTKATVELVGHDWRSDWEWERFVNAAREASIRYGCVEPHRVREFLTNDDGELCLTPRRLSAFYSRGAGKKGGFLDFSHWDVNKDTKGGNAGRPARIYALRPTT